MAYNELIDRSPASGVGTSPIALIAANPARKLFLVENVGLVYIAFAPAGIVPSVTAAGVGGVGSIVLAPGAGLVLDTMPVPTNAFTIVAESGSGNNVTCQEL